ncbi:MAG: sensor histidine kinase [Thermoleophilia bacterium]|nr:sensor histidine kinase [Thermoleophilia bacterium]
MERPADILASPAGGTAPAPRRPRILDPLPASIILALIFTAAGLVELLTRGGVPVGYREDGPALIVLTVASGLSLAALWWSPLGSLVAAVALLTVQAVAGYEYTTAAVWVVVIASFATVAFDQSKRAIAAGFVVTAGVVIVIFVQPSVSWERVLTTWISLSVVWVVAVVIRVYRGSIERAERRAALFAADREARAHEAVTEERARLARELHDSVGHALNVVVLHAGAAQRVIEKKPQLAREALEAIETAGRQALGDIERMLGILRAREEDTSYDVAPGMGQLEPLCAQVREAGLPVALTVEGAARPLPASLDLTAYRIVQEALTNTLKHAGRTSATVHVRYEEDALAIEVLDEGRGVKPAVDGGGRGLVGMRERVATFRGELEAGPRVEGGFGVRARLPLPGDDGPGRGATPSHFSEGTEGT